MLTLDFEKFKKTTIKYTVITITYHFKKVNVGNNV